MKIQASKSRLSHLPRKAQLALFLIGEELKSRKLFYVLNKVGLEYSFYQPHLDEAILSCVGLDNESEEIFDTYYQVIEKRCVKIKDDQKSVMKQALKVYLKLQQRREEEERQQEADL